MYLEHFGLDEYPFNLTPNTGYFYGRAGHQEALNVLLVAISGGEGFIKITGEVGTGKTLLCRRLLRELDSHYVTALIPNPALDPDSLRQVVARELYLPDNSGNAHEQLERLHHALLDQSRRGRRVLLIIDEAQTMPDESLEAVRLLTNLETEREKLLQVVLLGQPELDERMAQPHLRQLRQRCTFNYRLSPLPRPAVDDYLAHRLQTAGHRGGPLFTRAACRLIGWSARGIPRTLNTLAHKSLMAAFGAGDPYVDVRHVRRAMTDTETARRSWLAPRLATLGLL